ncbi:MAG: lamin tail domain-containing protein [Candidatus Zhuqueibacterota bacterium]
MKLWPVLLLLSFSILLTSCSTDESTGLDDKNEKSEFKLLINEFMASNDAASADADDNGSGDNSPYDDWFEIYNADSVAVNVAGMYVTDNLENLNQYQIPGADPAKTTIPPGGFIVIWADNEPDQGPLHANFALSGSGESIAIVESDGRLIINSLTYEAQQTDFSYGRNPDGSDTWQVFAQATPAASNTGASSNLPPTISEISVTPATIQAGELVTVSAKVTDTNLSGVSLSYGEAGNISASATMALANAVYQAQIGPFDDGKVIYYFITATDEEAARTQSDTLHFEVGYVPPVLFINEFLASNDSSFKDPDEDDLDGDPQDDWIEIYNPGPNPVNIAGMYITDKLSNLTAWQIPETDSAKTTIDAGGFVIIWADKEMQQGPLHVDIKLSGDGEQIGLIAPNGTTVIDSLTYGAQTEDISFGRSPDGSPNWILFNTPSPGALNGK